LTNFVKHAVEETRDDRKDCWLQHFQIVHQESNVPLEVAYSRPVDEDYTLKDKKKSLLIPTTANENGAFQPL